MHFHYNVGRIRAKSANRGRKSEAHGVPEARRGQVLNQSMTRGPALPPLNVPSVLGVVEREVTLGRGGGAPWWLQPVDGHGGCVVRAHPKAGGGKGVGWRPRLSPANRTAACPQRAGPGLLSQAPSLSAGESHTHVPWNQTRWRPGSSGRRRRGQRDNGGVGGPGPHEQSWSWSVAHLGLPPRSPRVQPSCLQGGPTPGLPSGQLCPFHLAWRGGSPQSSTPVGVLESGRVWGLRRTPDLHGDVCQGSRVTLDGEGLPPRAVGACMCVLGAVGAGGLGPLKILWSSRSAPTPAVGVGKGPAAVPGPHLLEGDRQKPEHLSAPCSQERPAVQNLLSQTRPADG